MGICDSQLNQKTLGIETKKTIKEELGMGHRPVPLKTANKLSKSICKITFTNNKNQKVYGTGFLMLYKSLKCLISVYHIINENKK